jgi:hypothetical protein
MKYLKKYNLFESKSEDVSIYDADWKELLPQEMIILKDGEHAFKLGNIMKHSNMIQVTYENANNEWGVPSTLQFDFHFSEVIEELIPNNVMRIDIDITWGEAMACEFYIDNTGKVEVIEYTSFNSKTDPSNTIFALDDNSLKSFVEFLNRFGLSNFDVTDFEFLDKEDNYQPK